MDTAALKKFAPTARTLLREQVSSRLNQVLAEGSAPRREAPNGVRELEGEISGTSRDQVVERVAYAWFNRFTALRFMDANGYTGTRVVSPADGQTRPEILAEAAAGVIGEEVPEAVAAQVRALLDNRTPSRDPQGEAYRLLLVAICNHWHGAMPFMFEKIADCTELLMPDDLLSANSLLARLRAVMTEDACRDIEVIGWLYQFYISEKKDQVFAGLKKNVKITVENIPAATQLFTPHWIVRYLVENSLGRLWLVNRPQTKLVGKMEYYITPNQPETEFPRITRPEEIRICDPACGSGHMLTYAFDLLYDIYEEEGYETAEIPGLILAHNLYGIEIDDRAGALAAFALVMKAAAKLGRRRLLRMRARPNICILRNVDFTPSELPDVVALVGREFFTSELRDTLGQFEKAKGFGSLIVPPLHNATEVAQVVAHKDIGDDLLLRDVQGRVLAVLQMAETLLPKYHVVLANPPYMSIGGMNENLANFAKANYPISKFDLFAMFIERSIGLALELGSIAMVTIQNWMFLSSFEKLRMNIIENNNLLNLMQIGYNSFPELNSKVVQAAAFVITKGSVSNVGSFINLNDAAQAANKELVLRKKILESNIYYVSSKDFEKIPGAPIAYWVNHVLLDAFTSQPLLTDRARTAQGMATSDNERFLRFWPELSVKSIVLGASDRREALETGSRWFPYNKGGEYRTWYGNQEFVVNWQYDGKEIRNAFDETGKLRSRPQNLDLFFKESISWSKVSSSAPAFRYFPNGFAFDVAGTSVFFPSQKETFSGLGFLNSSVSKYMLSVLSPTLNYEVGHISSLPFANINVANAVEMLVSISKLDWDAYETSWHFTRSPLLAGAIRARTLEGTYALLRAFWREQTLQMKRLEEENNDIFIKSYGLCDELRPELPLEIITLTCNPAYRYGVKGTEEERDARQCADTIAEFLHYAVGCMFGRYSLDVPGLVLANQGDGMPEYLAKVPDTSFAPDEDNVIPMLDGDWFPDDVSERFRQFLRVTFGEANFQENLAFIEVTLGKDIRKYFARDFFNDHIKRYKKRPIYWLFSSPKGTFNALIYMHRYRPDTVSIVLNNYLRELRNKLEAYRRGQEALSISGEASQAQRSKGLKEVEATGKQIAELDAYERNVLFPLASRRIEIDLDDGVKANYLRFGDALKPIKGLAEAED